MLTAMAAKRAGKPSNFSDEQNAALRDALAAFMERNGMNQPAMAKKLDIEQPSVGRYIQTKNPAGFSYPIATKVARLAGYPGVDAFFVAKGVALDARATEPDPNVDDCQLQAMIHARALNVSEKAIELVNRRVDTVNFYSAAWWATRYLEQEEALLEARRELGPPPQSEASLALIPDEAGRARRRRPTGTT